MADAPSGRYAIPFDPKSGSLLSYARLGTPNATWKANHRFDGPLRYHGFARGRSAAHLVWRDGEGRLYPMFLTDADVLFRVRNLVDGEVNGPWTFVKRGQNYGIRLDITTTEEAAVAHDAREQAWALHQRLT